MTDKQLYKYRAEWSRAWKALRAAGHHANEKADDVRKRWHLYIGAVYLRGPDAGKPKSSLVLNNAEFDRFLKRCAASHSPDDLLRQLDLDAQPMLRLRHATDPIFDRMAFDKSDAAREAYLRGIYKNLQRPAAANGEQTYAIEEMPGDEDLQRIVIALTHTAAHKLGEQHGHPSHAARGNPKFQNPKSQRNSGAAAPHSAIRIPQSAIVRAEGEEDWPF